MRVMHSLCMSGGQLLVIGGAESHDEHDDDRLRSFDPWAGNPGRGMLLDLGGIHVLLDYAHNPAAIAAVTGVLHRVWG
jgi:folylpolyglutamate synthase/dihydropteroate synthase